MTRRYVKRGPTPCRTAALHAGALVARTGDEMSGPALMLAGLARTGSAAAGAALLAGITVAAAVGGPLLGALLDRTARPGRLLATALVLYAAGLALVLLGLGRLPFAVSVLLAVVTGLLGPALSGGWTAQLPRVVPAGGLPRANALDAMTFGAASLAGPALAGGTAALLGAPPAVLVSAALIGAAVPAAWLLPARPGAAHGPRTASVPGDLAAGVRALATRPRLARATLTSVVCCAAQGMLTACLPQLGERVLGGAGRGTALLSCAAATALAANALLARFPRAIAPDTVLWTTPLIQASAPALAALSLAASGGPALLVTAAALTGIAEGPALTALFAVRHREAPARLRGQIFTTGASLKITAFALGAALAAALSPRSLPLTLTLSATTAAAATLLFFALPASAHRDTVPPSTADSR
ncbi:MFS transporter [Streptomyces shenzhenensis]|uniref:MFS transporter n=1 Tax=Streptomyces shenzhenensis TaxID=943815 RepID=UPI0033DD9D42